MMIVFLKEFWVEKGGKDGLKYWKNDSIESNEENIGDIWMRYEKGLSHTNVFYVTGFRPPRPPNTLPGKWCPWEFSPLGQAEMHQQIAFSETSATRSPMLLLECESDAVPSKGGVRVPSPTFWRQGALWIPEVTLCDFPSQVIKAV